MQKRPIPLFINPAAGRGRVRRLAASICNLLADNGVACEEIHSNAVGDLEYKVFAAASAGADRIIVAGGDGSMHEAINGILRSASKTALGVIPVGTGNDFAKACSIPLNWEDAARLLANRFNSDTPVRCIDAGRMNDRYFANGAGIGFDAKINHIARGNRLPVGDLVYLIAVCQGVWDGVITPDVQMRSDNVNYAGPVTLVEVCNGPSVGGMFRIAPMAKNDDGFFDLVMVKPISRLRIFALLPRLIKGSHVGAPEVMFARVNSVTLIADSPVPSHLDGEIQPLQTEFRVEILPDALNIV